MAQTINSKTNLGAAYAGVACAGLESSSSTGTSVFAYDGDNLVEETNSSGTAVARYEYTRTSMSRWLCFEAAQRAITTPMGLAQSRHSATRLGR